MSNHNSISQGILVLALLAALAIGEAITESINPEESPVE